MKRTVVLMLVLISALVWSGCGAKKATDPQTIFSESAREMALVSGYRIHGSMSIEALDAEGNAAGDPLVMEVNGQVEMADGAANQYLVAAMGPYESEAYIIGTDYYQNMAGQGWAHIGVEEVTSQNPSMGVMNAEQMEFIAGIAESTEIIKEDEQEVGLVIRLGEDFFRATLETYLRRLDEEGKAMDEEERRAGEEAVSQMQAEMRIWIKKDTRLISAVEVDYEVNSEAMGGRVRNASRFDLFDYNDPDIVVELPEEAKQAPELNVTPGQAAP